MHNIWRRIWNEERAQDLVEYTVLMAAIALVASGLLLNVGSGAAGIWKSGGTQLTAANTASSGVQAPAGGGKHGGGHDGHQDD